MKNIFIFLVINILALGVLLYLLDNLPLFEKEQIQLLEEKYNVVSNEEFYAFIEQLKAKGFLYDIINKQNFWTMIFVVFVTIFSFCNFVHLLIDKLFFKSFYQEPSLPPSLRRSIIISILILSIFFLKFFALLDPLFVVLFILIFILLELIFRENKTEKSENHTKESTAEQSTI